MYKLCTQMYISYHRRLKYKDKYNWERWYGYSQFAYIKQLPGTKEFYVNLFHSFVSCLLTLKWFYNGMNKL